MVFDPADHADAFAGVDDATAQRLQRARAAWRWVGDERPPWADEPAPAQESVWDYPRPPVVVPDSRHVVVRNGRADPNERPLVDTRRAVRVLETAGAPAFYVPPDDVDVDQLVSVAGASMCEWKGVARYWALRDDPGRTVGWDYPEALVPYQELAGWRSFYPALVECTVDGERVRPQPGGFYGGWMTDEIAGPVKGEGGSAGW